MESGSGTEQEYRRTVQRASEQCYFLRDDVFALQDEMTANIVPASP
jgi:hypothetical protein